MIKPAYNIGIIGCGKMGEDLFKYLTGFPFHVILICKTEISVEQLKNTFKKKQNRALKHGIVDQDTYDFWNKNTIISTDLKLLKTCDIIIESINEDLNQKRRLFSELANVISPNCIVTSNSSSISPARLFPGILNEENSLGLHFFFPVSMKDIVEVNLSAKTSDKTLDVIKNFLGKINKFFIVLEEHNRFLINKLFLKMQAGCCQIFQDGKLSFQDIDDQVKAHLFPVGVFEFFDQVGNDVMLHSVKNYVDDEPDLQFYQPIIELLSEKVREGKLGVKSKVGFYAYPKGKIGNSGNENSGDITNEITAWYLDGVFEAIKNTNLTIADLEHIVKEYMAVEKSPFELAKEIGYTPK